MNRPFDEPSFGEKLSPVLQAIEDTIWEHEINFKDEPPQYTNDGFRAATKIFMSAICDKMFANDILLKRDIKYMERHAELIGKEIREFIKTHTNVDTYDLYRQEG